MKMRLATWLLAFGLIGSLAALPTMAQQDNGGGGGNGGATDNGGGNGGGNNNNNNGGGGGNRRGNGGGGGFAQFQAQRLQRIKDAMQASDDDWKALEPKIQAVQQLQMQQMMGRMRQGRGPGGNNQQQDPNTPTNPVAQAQRDLQATLDNKDATPDQIKTKLQALRDARKKAADDLKKTQDDLRDLLTVRQEAVLVTQGILD